MVADKGGFGAVVLLGVEFPENILDVGGRQLEVGGGGDLEVGHDALNEATGAGAGDFATVVNLGVGFVDDEGDDDAGIFVGAAGHEAAVIQFARITLARP